LFNITIEKVVRDSGINLRGTIFYESVQILAYTDDTDIIARMQKNYERSFYQFGKEARKMHLQVNEGKYIYTSYQENIVTLGFLGNATMKTIVSP
jgi:hypothetical protein